MLKRLWEAEKAAWRAWKQVFRPVVEPEALPTLTVTSGSADPQSQPTQTAAAVAYATPLVVLQGGPDVPDAFPDCRWVLLDAEDAPCKGLHGMTSAELTEIRDWPWRKYDRKQRSWR